MDIKPVTSGGCSSEDMWVTLEKVKSGQVRLQLYWMPVSTKESDYRCDLADGDVDFLLNDPECMRHILF